MKFHFLFCLFIILILFSCHSSPKMENQINFEITREFKMDTADIVYQYHQQFGFAELCDEIKMVIKGRPSPNFPNQLPLSQKDRDMINSFSNKADSLPEDHIDFETNSRPFFYDIETKFSEFIKKEKPQIHLLQGEYKIMQTGLADYLWVYDQTTKLLYFEVHRCQR